MISWKCFFNFIINWIPCGGTCSPDFLMVFLASWFPRDLYCGKETNFSNFKSVELCNHLCTVGKCLPKTFIHTKRCNFASFLLFRTKHLCLKHNRIKEIKVKRDWDFHCKWIYFLVFSITNMWRVAAKGTLSRLPLCLIYNHSKPINNKYLERIINSHNSGSFHLGLSPF